MPQRDSPAAGRHPDPAAAVAGPARDPPTAFLEIRGLGVEVAVGRVETWLDAYLQAEALSLEEADETLRDLLEQAAAATAAA